MFNDYRCLKLCILESYMTLHILRCITEMLCLIRCSFIDSMIYVSWWNHV